MSGIYNKLSDGSKFDTFFIILISAVTKLRGYLHSSLFISGGCLDDILLLPGPLMFALPIVLMIEATAVVGNLFFVP